MVGDIFSPPFKLGALGSQLSGHGWPTGVAIVDFERQRPVSLYTFSLKPNPKTLAQRIPGEWVFTVLDWLGIIPLRRTKPRKENSMKLEEAKLDMEIVAGNNSDGVPVGRRGKIYEITSCALRFRDIDGTNWYLSRSGSFELLSKTAEPLSKDGISAVVTLRLNGVSKEMLRTGIFKTAEKRFNALRLKVAQLQKLGFEARASLSVESV